jgi:hypothetical protein
LYFKKKEETDRAKTFLFREMGLNLKRDMRRNVPINFTREEMGYYMKHFRKMDVENKGFLTLSDLKRHLQVRNYKFLCQTCLHDFALINIENCMDILFQSLYLSGLVSSWFENI